MALDEVPERGQIHARQAGFLLRPLGLHPFRVAQVQYLSRQHLAGGCAGLLRVQVLAFVQHDGLRHV